jgi:hypothetical protein
MAGSREAKLDGENGLGSRFTALTGGISTPFLRKKSQPGQAAEIWQEFAKSLSLHANHV